MSFATRTTLHVGFGCALAVGCGLVLGANIASAAAPTVDDTHHYASVEIDTIGASVSAIPGVTAVDLHAGNSSIGVGTYVTADSAMLAATYFDGSRVLGAWDFGAWVPGDRLPTFFYGGTGKMMVDRVAPQEW